MILRLLNSLDLYVYIDLDYPSNYDSVLKMMSSNIMDYLPNIFESLTDDEGEPLPPRLTFFSVDIHFFKNMGQAITIAFFLFTIRLLTMPFAKYVDSKSSNIVMRFLGKLSRGLGVEFWIGYFEANHVDLVLSTVIYVANPQPYATWSNSKLVLVIMLIINFLALLTLYGYMVRSVEKMASKRQAVGEVLDFETKQGNHTLSFLLEDKVCPANFI